MRNFHMAPGLQEELMKTLSEEQKKLEQVNTDVRTLNAQRNDSRQKVASFTAAVKEMQGFLRAHTSELTHEKERLQNIDKALESLKVEQEQVLEKMRSDRDKIKQIEAQCQEAEKQLAEARLKKKDLDDQVELIQQDMDKVGGASYIKLKHSVKAAKDRVRVLEKKNSECEATVTAGSKQKLSREKAVDNAEAEEIRAKDYYESLDNADEEEDEKIAEAKAKVKEVKQEFEARKKLLEKAEKSRDKCKATLNTMKQDEAKMQHDLRIAKGEYEAVRSKGDALEKQLSDIDSAVRKSIAEYGTTILDPEEVEDPTTFDHTKYTVVLEESDLEGYDLTQVKRTIQKLEETQKKLTPNIKALAEWKEKNRILIQRSEDLRDVSERRTQAQATVEALRRQRHEEFMSGFRAISYKLKEMYQMLTMGGDAELELVDRFDPFTEGLQFSVRPPKKSWKHISNLSGGEKTLSSLSLVFALHHFKPTPLYVMDEIDAALDFKNVSIVANYITSAARNAQFIIISLRNNMFELANRLIGICKTENCTKSAAINPAEFVSILPPVPDEPEVTQKPVKATQQSQVESQPPIPHQASPEKRGVKRTSTETKNTEDEESSPKKRRVSTEEQ